MALKLTNNARGTLSAAISAVATSITLQPGEGALFPALAGGDWCPVVLEEGAKFEIVRVTARAGDILTIARGQEGTVALTYGVGARADLRVTEATMQAILELATPAAVVAAVNANIAAKLPLAGGQMSGTLVSAAADALRLKNGSYGLIVRQDGTALYFLMTAAGDQDGTWNALRPLTISLATGNVSFTHDVALNGTVSGAALAAAGAFRAATSGKLLTAGGVWTDADFAPLTDAASIVLSMSGMTTMASVTLGADRALANPTNTKNGQFFCIKLNATGATRTLTLGANFKVPAGVESFPISITTAETVYLCGFIESSAIARVTAVVRYT